MSDVVSLQSEHTPIDQRISELLLAETPESWRVIQLDIERQPQPERGDLFRLAISSPEHHPDAVFPTKEMHETAHVLADVFARHGRVWSRASYRVEVLDVDKWKYSVSFVY